MSHHEHHHHPHDHAAHARPDAADSLLRASAAARLIGVGAAMVTIWAVALLVIG